MIFALGIFKNDTLLFEYLFSFSSLAGVLAHTYSTVYGCFTLITRTNIITVDEEHYTAKGINGYELKKKKNCR